MKNPSVWQSGCRVAAMLFAAWAAAWHSPLHARAQVAPTLPRTSRSFDPGLAGASVIPPQPYLLVDAFPFAPIFGYPVANLGFPQPLGHQIVETSPNSYYYRPVTDLGSFAARAVAALRAANYAQVLVELEPVLAETPDDGQAWMLRAQALFGLASYPQAAQALHAALRLLPREEWGRPVLKSSTYFASAVEYRARLRALEGHVATHPREGSGHFLLGYYYGYSGKVSAAERELRTALQLMTGDDSLAQALLSPAVAQPRAPGDDKPRPGLPRVEPRPPREF